jgi:hypothetical protein
VLVAGLTLVAAITVGFASTGNLPTQHSPTSVVKAEIAAELSAQASASALPASLPSDHRRTTPVAPVAAPTGATGSSTPTPTTTTTANQGVLVWLCHQWMAQPSGSTSANNPFFQLLIKAAGGVDGMNAYCSTLLTTGAPPSVSATPTPTDPPASPTPTPTPTN